MRNKMNNKGVTLVEVMIALVVLLIVFMGLIQASIVTIDSNVRNVMRDEAVRIASEYMAVTKGTALFSSLTDTGTENFGLLGTWTTAGRSFRNIPMQYTIKRSVFNLDASSNKRIGIQAQWTYRWQTFNHEIFSTMRNK